MNDANPLNNNQLNTSKKRRTGYGGWATYEMPTLYWVSAEPPLLAGSTHEKCAVVAVMLVTVRLRGLPGTVRARVVNVAWPLAPEEYPTAL
jgi:hypothetical protein